MKIKRQKPLPRAAGTLLPVFSLPSEHGIGTLGREARNFIDFLKAAGQSYWQVLPMGPTGYGDSPYQSFSSFAGSPYYIDLDMLLEEGLLKRAEVRAADFGGDCAAVDYGRLFLNRLPLLRKAYARSSHRGDPAFAAFCRENESWLPDYALYTALKKRFSHRSWLLWPEGIKRRERPALAYYRKALADDVDFHIFCQFKFFSQWGALKEYANKNGISIIGDIPIYTALDSADTWANRELFDLSDDCAPERVAGVPPDAFSKDGQLWGNPLYNWEEMEARGFDFWKRRIRSAASLFDVIRIDHFIGIVHYYAIPADSSTAASGRWVKGPGEKLITAINEAAAGKRIIAEDLGEVSDEVRALIRKSGYPGMRVLQFGFGGGVSNPHLPYLFEQNSVIYGGTHDNETLKGFFSHQKRALLRHAKDYLGVKRTPELPAALIRAGHASVASVAIFQLQDYMGLDNTARINTPSTVGGNWGWRLMPGQLKAELAEEMRALAELYGRAGTDGKA